MNAEVVGSGEEIGILVGYNKSGSISCCYSDGIVRGGRIVGGLVGYNGPHSGAGGTVSNCYSASSVIAGSLAGGLVGINNGFVSSSYSVGEVGLGEYVGGLVGNGHSYKVVDSFWDVEASGQTESAGGMGLTTSEMMDTYWYALNGWAGDPNWVLDSGKDYPRLAWEATAGQPIPKATIEWLDGSGTALDPYRLVDADQLFRIGRASILWNAHFVLYGELDLSNITWSTAVIPRFAGIFDGRNFNIRNLTITGRNNLGLFGKLEDGAVVRNVGIVDANVRSKGDYTGILVGLNIGDVMNCHSNGMVTSDGGWTGGLVGSNSGSITSCFSTSNVRGGGYQVGGLAGANYTLVAYCYSTGAVSGDSTGAVNRNNDVGGLVGYNRGQITECYSTGYVSGQPDLGGLVGTQVGGSVAHSFWDTQISRQTTSAGGTGKTTAEMQEPNTFMAAGWDFVSKPDGPSDIWAEPIGGGYPILWWQLSPLPELPTFSGGTGEPEDPYFITTAKELSSIGYNPRLTEAHFKLMADVDLWGLAFYPIGNEAYPYASVFDGNSHTISNLTYDSNSVDCIGLFGCVNDPNVEIKDLGLIDPNINAGTGDYVGSLVGYLRDGTITDCYVEGGSVSGDYYVGGLVGGGLVGAHGEEVRSRGGSTISNCWSTSIVQGTLYVGGLVGYNDGDYLTDCYSTGAVSGTELVGGLVGRSSFSGTICNCYSSGSVSGNWSVGGLVGSNSSTITDCYSIGSVLGGDYVGGIVGENSYRIVTSYSTGMVTGDRSVGGLVGYNDRGYLTDCYSSSEVSGSDYVGGLVGNNEDGAATRCYSTGTVTGYWSVGGLLGYNDAGGVTDCYSTGAVSGTDSVGGLVGFNIWEVGVSALLWGPEPELRHMLTNCYSTGSVSGDFKVGGLVGANNINGTINRCYSIGSVSGNEDIGGLVGYNEGRSVTDCYSTSAVSGTDSIGGLVGADNGTVGNSFWDIETSGQSNMCGRQMVYGKDCNNANGKTTAEMQTQSTFLDAGWDFVTESVNGTEDIWSICEGVDYPRLTWQFVIGDFDGDAKVGFADFAIFAAHWLGTDSSFWCAGGGTDLTNDGKIHFDDLREFAENWLQPQPQELPPPPSPPPSPPPKGRGCFPADTPVWVNGSLVQISNVVSGQMAGELHCEAATDCLEQIETVEEHEGTFECRDIVLESGNRISV
ncbi:MAG: GLUG motif-containing protein, partial [Planctomycetota bacterium]